MKVMLVEPPHKYWKVFRFDSPAPGLAHLAAALSGEFQVLVVDFISLERSWFEFEQILERERPDVVGIPCVHTPYLPDALQVAALVKMILPQTVVIGGGFQFSFLPQESLRPGQIDFIIRGEGEATTLELLRALQSGQKDFSAIQGLSYIEGDRYVSTPDRPLMADIKELPLPAWQLFPMRNYSITPMGGSTAFNVSSSRGCRHFCSFCSEGHMWNSVVRFHPPEYAVDQLELLYRDFDKTVFMFGDNNFLDDLDWLDHFCRLLEKRALPITFQIQSTCRDAVAKQQFLPRLRRLGCYQVLMGLESLSSDVLKAYRKPQDRELMKQAVKAVRKSGLSIFGCFIWGDWNDTAQTLEQIVDFTLNNCDFYGPNLLVPFPGTDYFKQCYAQGRIEEWNLRLYNQYYAVMPTRTLSRARVQELFDRAVVSPRVRQAFLRQAFFHPSPVGRTWGREYFLLEWYFDNPRLKVPQGIPFSKYLEETGRAEPPWRIAFPPTPQVEEGATRPRSSPY